MIRWILFLGIYLLIGIRVIGQGELIDTVSIEAKSIRSVSFSNQSIELETGQSLAQELTSQGAVFIKNYGPGSLATSSIRGGSAGHTLVIWNNLPIQNPFLGLLDLSLIDTWSTNKATLIKGGNSASWGSGAVGGMVALEQKNTESDLFRFENDLSIGSFSKIHERARVAYKLGSFRGVTHLSYLQAENDFPYQISGGQDVKTQTNAAQIQSNFNQDLYWDNNDDVEVGFHYWRMRANRQNPPTTTQSKSTAYQEDAADRFSFQWRKMGEHNRIELNVGFFNEQLDYYDPSLNIESLTSFKTFAIDVNDEFQILNDHKIGIGGSYYYAQVASPANYEKPQSQNRAALFASYQYKWIKLTARQELVDGNLIPFIPAFSLAIPISRKFVLNGSVGRNFRLPTLNDKFWVPGGNVNLLPESGWSQEMGLSYKYSKLNASGTIFNRVINDWIQWTLLEGSRVYSPYNINQVWSRGLELDFTYEYKIMSIKAGYNLTKSTHNKASSFPKIEKGQQLFYTPVHTANIGIALKYKQWSWNYNHQFTGDMIGVNENLTSYQLGNSTLAFNAARYGIYFSGFNIWNADYRIIERRPMPGRNFELGLKFNINKQ